MWLAENVGIWSASIHITNRITFQQKLLGTRQLSDKVELSVWNIYTWLLHTNYSSFKINLPLERNYNYVMHSLSIFKEYADECVYHPSLWWSLIAQYINYCVLHLMMDGHGFYWYTLHNEQTMLIKGRQVIRG